MSLDIGTKSTIHQLGTTRNALDALSVDDATVLTLPLPELMERAAALRDSLFGTRVTYSPKVFIPLTSLCRDGCGYCTFSRSPARAEAPYLTPDQVLAIAMQGAQAGCHEALFTLGEQPEDRYDVAAQWLADHGYGSTVEYLAAMCRLVTAETGLLAHSNAGALAPDALSLLRTVSPGQGMMIESLNPTLMAHRGAPDKTPERRLATLEAAGELAIPFTTGILVGIGESPQDRVTALRAIADLHRRYGHVQEVIVQNFMPKPDTVMRNEPACPQDDFLRTVAVARLILPPDVHLQAPPNLSEDLGPLLDAGIDDFGGVSPVTVDHVNPERPWPSLDRLREVTERDGKFLTPRLTVYPEFARRPDQWIDPGLRFAILDRSDAESLGRDDPGAMFPESHADAKNVGTGAEVVQIGRRSTVWSSGSEFAPTDLVPSRRRGFGGPVTDVLDGIASGQEPGVDEIVTLFGARGGEVAEVAEFADHLRFGAVGDDVTFVRNRNINYTNVCTFKCTFCGFSKGPLSLNLRGKPYLLTLQEVAGRVREAWDLGCTEVCLQGGIHPSFDGDYYIDVCRAAKEAAPDIHVHGFTALEVTEGAKRIGEPLEKYLQRLVDAGLKSLPGTAAEILDDDVRAILCPDKIDTEEWLECHRVAHSMGLTSNVTMMFGTVEEPVHWARHFLRTRELQRETGGFTEFVGLPFVHMAAPIYLKRGARRGPTWREVVLVHAIARIVYDGLIDNVQASWVKLGLDGVRQLLQAGVNDVGGTLMDENISRAAGAAHGQQLDETDLESVVQGIGRRLRRRTTNYLTPPTHQLDLHGAPTHSPEVILR
ncbi:MULTISPECIES: 5-amino-6-(D-ribitylamino)uracil--L-tyrosine 4-hydroxyphenyl transferase CofH [unclassified Rhodococcus (in: high G+C Gram-positive bacteria)]|uniref:5-amino-6-(D-ribitylamino)uracil--L-tyrosine 4-hydroxyphenyl transferase CofH n=1 Tax=unclassified Rhodococcus (in: high G+C Gram-positive bacteria) TaxID=192944 RepID=UPI00163B12E8|nr:MULTISPECIES: 5-amino-6-(D-ribitylamino)uracil--L-tyrosine 4-hydroxyphenyl transferase CofH [unclassified Rhodococcus (in: high G+C Gram-positive bacteria)]MBC2637895.1 5-amino-6-(D-ribitylamino)uracil--L-tyrosine 4-hydroxyphenyl transferase CofH [Rhodococcus sp. 3A]MBC2897357.1 5-amino-6-(D-ribitylamino)uracil--L-tyrosine 4-hydroxyphenyl transferase CofH [Rhodococcus sp. 4CII]